MALGIVFERVLFRTVRSYATILQHAMLIERSTLSLIMYIRSRFAAHIDIHFLIHFPFTIIHRSKYVDSMCTCVR